MSTEQVIGEVCRVCKRNVEQLRHGDPGEKFCSNFCDETSPDQKIAFLTAKPGDWCVFPCTGCGCAIEDEYEADGALGVCSDCWLKVKLAKAWELLDEVYPFLSIAMQDKITEAKKKYR